MLLARLILPTSQLVIAQFWPRADSRQHPCLNPQPHTHAQTLCVEDIDVESADIVYFREIAALGDYLAFDRPDIQHSLTEVCLNMSKYTTGRL